MSTLPHPEYMELIERANHPEWSKDIFQYIAGRIEDAESAVYCSAKALYDHEEGSVQHVLQNSGNTLFQLRMEIEELDKYQDQQRETEEQALTPATTTPSPVDMETDAPNYPSKLFLLKDLLDELPANDVVLGIVAGYLNAAKNSGGVDNG